MNTRHRLLLFILLGAGLLLAACTDDNPGIGRAGGEPGEEPSGDLVRQTIDVTSFDSLDIGSGFQVTVRRGPPSTVIEVDDNLLDRVVATNRDGLLRITLESGAPFRDATLRATITMPTLAEVRLSGATRVEFLEPVPIPADLDIDLAGASRLTGDFTAAAISIRAEGASRIDAAKRAPIVDGRALGASRLDFSGTAGKLELELSGASHGELRDLETRRASLDLSGASDLEITVTARITRLNLTGASEIDYFGNAVIDSQTVTGASRVNQR